MKNKKKKAAALKYFKENLDTPELAAFGEGDLADKIIEEAKKNSIKIVENEKFFDFCYILLFFINRIIKTNEGSIYEKKNIY